MKGTLPKATQEPVGIVISGWPQTQRPTVFSAYVWGPAPATSEDESKAG